MEKNKSIIKFIILLILAVIILKKGVEEYRYRKAILRKEKNYIENLLNEKLEKKKRLKLMSILEKVYYEESNNIESIEKFKLRYPKSIYINEINKKEELIKYISAKNNRNMLQINKFINSYPNSKYCDELRKEFINIIESKLITIEGNKNIKSFKIGMTEVTQEDYEAVMEINSTKFEKNPLKPIDNITFYDAVEFCNRLSILNKEKPYYVVKVKRIDENGVIREAKINENKLSKGYRLPMAEEWEYAAKGGNFAEKYIYSGSNNSDEISWNILNSKNKPNNIAQKRPNKLGIYDMSGNLWEWCYNEALGGNRVIKGGSWESEEKELEISNWGSYFPGYRYNFIGFRIVKDL